MKTYKIAIIGGGPAGIIAAIAASQNLNNINNNNHHHHHEDIILIEKNNSLGKKLLLTGNGRCNIANSKSIREQLNLLKHKNFLKHSFYSFSNEDLIAIFKDKGLDFKEEKDGRYFPITDDANSILAILKDYLNNLNIKILLDSPVKSISKEGIKEKEEKKGDRDKEKEKEKNKEKDLFLIDTDSISLKAEKVIIATGGNSYPQTGSTGDGYDIAKSFDHEITPIKPGLISLSVKNSYFKHLSGISLENLNISFKEHSIKGDLLFTHFGLSGPGILDISNFIVESDYKSDYNSNNLSEKIVISLDLIPNSTKEELSKRIIADSQSNGKTMVKNYLKHYLKNRFIDYFLNIAQISGNKTLSNLSKKDRNKIIAKLKDFQVEIANTAPRETAMITCGGISTKKINSKTMESKLIQNLYFAGELLEPYGPTGGYNLQIAFSTGFLAGKSSTESFN
ncbi:MAG: NAD(P)/FAD-dependent oxidoreductase [Methanobrevibacter sp.]|jgi:predicted Rossmann fold flavoprotein|nr:NAD(P)/FAD-dependent oxidoreductase [Methanobrevibacter sp.]